MTSRVMRAIRVAQFGGPEVLKLVSDVPVPKPAAKEVLIKIFVAGVNPVETYIRNGKYATLPNLPYTPGGDAAGVVEEVGPEVTKFKKGERVFTVRTETGSYAEYAVASTDFTFHLPDALNFSQGAAAGSPYFTAYKALVLRGSPKAGESVLVHGASGNVGIACCQLARSLGLKVLGTAGTEEGMKLVLQNKAHLAFNHRDPDYEAKIKEATGGKGVDIILEMLANVNLEKDLGLIASRGRIVIIGNRGTIEINPRGTMGKECDIRGMALFASTPDEWKELAAGVNAGLEGGIFKPHIGREYSLGDAAKAHTQVIEQEGGTKGRIVLSISNL